MPVPTLKSKKVSVLLSGLFCGDDGREEARGGGQRLAGCGAALGAGWGREGHFYLLLLTLGGRNCCGFKKNQHSRPQERARLLLGFWTGKVRV